ncbi:hypothetical protein KIPB_015912, partial [Kipferlia bialata]|eukprot:g15912.t1
MHRGTACTHCVFQRFQHGYTEDNGSPVQASKKQRHRQRSFSLVSTSTTSSSPCSFAPP